MSDKHLQRPASPPPVATAWEELSGQQQRRIRQDLQRMLDHPEAFIWRHHPVSDKWQAIPQLPAEVSS